jgi:acyl-CoA reductase-like NAD-dependent aldehyde dehydrogenase
MKKELRIDNRVLYHSASQEKHMSELCRIINPWDGSTAGEFPVDSDETLLKKVEIAQRTFQDWKRTPLDERIALVERVIALAEKGRDDIARSVTRQMGKPVSEAQGEVGRLVERARMMASIAPRALADDYISIGDGISRRIVRDPLGPVVNVAAWNYPLVIAINVVVPAVLAGNTVLLKHASQTAEVGLLFERLFRDAGAPEGLVTAVTVPGRRASILLEHPAVTGVYFTGSVEAGRQVYRTVANRKSGFIDAGLELGGKDPAYVRADMDLSIVVPNLVEGAFYNAGQSCCSVERIYVDKALYPAFLEAYLAEARGWSPADPMDEKTILGPVAAEETLQTLDAQVSDALARGATLHCGGQREEGPGWRYPVTVLGDVNHSMAVMREESFGPMIGIMPVANDEEAIALMNDSAFGLTASIWTSDFTVGQQLARQTSAGTVFVNRCDYVDPALPWTGLRDSGKGITLSHLGFDEVTRARGIHARPIEMLRT